MRAQIGKELEAISDGEEMVNIQVKRFRFILVLAFYSFLLILGSLNKVYATSPGQIWGFADIHNHQFAYLGFGGLVMWGNAFDPNDDIAKALPWDDFSPAPLGLRNMYDSSGNPIPFHKVDIGPCPFCLPGTDDVVDIFGNPVLLWRAPSAFLPHLPNIPATCSSSPCWGAMVHGEDGKGDLFNNFLTGNLLSGHPDGGYPDFSGWPKWNNYTGQQVYYRWLERAYQGGLRLMVMFAVNNESICKISNRLAAYGCDDMPSVDRQIEGAKELEAFIDSQNGGPGQGWYRIAYSATEARNILNSGKMAVILGAEVDSLFGCKKNSGCTTSDMVTQLDLYHQMGLRHIFPIHIADNAYGDTAIYEPIFDFSNKMITGDYFSVGTCPTNAMDFHLDFGFAALLGVLMDPAGAGSLSVPSGSNCNAGNPNGLTLLGEDLVNAMMDRKMIIDVDHMSARSLNQVLSIAEQRHYPGIVSV